MDNNVRADDIVLIAKEKQDLKGMIRRLKRYIERKGLILSTEK